MRYRTKTFHIRFSEKEYDRLCKYAAKAGIPKTTYIRHMINGCQPKEKPPVDFWTFMKELHALGNNLNQLAQTAYRFGSIHTAKLEETYKQYCQFLLAITDRMQMPIKLDVPATLERGRLLAEKEQKEGTGDAGRL